MTGLSPRRFLSLTAALPLRVVVGALKGASINAALRQQEKPYNRPDGRGNAIPLWWLAPPPCPVGSVSLDSQSPTAPCESSSLATRWEACHWIRGSWGSPMNPVPLPPPRSSVGRQKESALMGRLGALLRPTWRSYAGPPQGTIKLRYAVSCL